MYIYIYVYIYIGSTEQYFQSHGVPRVTWSSLVHFVIEASFHKPRFTNLNQHKHRNRIGHTTP